MTFGHLTPHMDEVLSPFIQNKEVWDLGAGSLGYAKHLLRLGAGSVVAVDKEGFQPSRYKGHNILPVERYFADVQVPPEGIRVAWVSWPTNHSLYGLLPLLMASDVVVYLGSNTSGSACGWPALYNHFHSREILAHVPHQRNTLAVYGRTIPGRGPLIGEELAALAGQFLDFEEAEEQAIRAARIVQEAV